MSVTRHLNHGNHPVGVLGYLLILVGFSLGGIWITLLATGGSAWTVTTGVAALVAFLAATVILTAMTRRLHHSALTPDNTSEDVEHYLAEYR